ncbi:MAG: hypothetical protein H6Q70_512 [Firmicutes bacterium]|nr:hypothetical protein [Bacillota bacterium]
MANTLLTPSIIARESLMALENNMVFGGLVYHNYSAEFANVGDTITIRKPATFKTDEFDGEIELQDAKETGVPIVMNKLFDVSFPISLKDLNLNIVNFSEQFVQPAMMSIAQTVDASIAALYADVPYYFGAAGTTPGTVAAITGVRKIMNDNKVPLVGRNLVVNTDAEAALLELDAFNRVDASGTDAALVEASLGRKFGFDTYMDQNIKTHSNGGFTATPAVTISTEVSAGANTAVLTATALTGTIKKGTIFKVAGDTQPYVITADVTAAANSATVSFYPAAEKTMTATAVVTIVSDHAANIAFHKNAFAMVSRQLTKPMGNTESSYVNYNGLGLRVTIGYDIKSKTDIVSIDMLCGFKTIQPELAARLIG